MMKLDQDSKASAMSNLTDTSDKSIVLAPDEIKALKASGTVVIERGSKVEASEDIDHGKVLIDALNQMIDMAPSGMEWSAFGAIGQHLAVLERHRPVGWSYVDHEVTFEYSDNSSRTMEQLTDEQAESGYYDYKYMDEICAELDRRGTPKVHDELYDLSTEDGKPLWRKASEMPLWASRLAVKVLDIGAVVSPDQDGKNSYTTKITLVLA